MDFFTSSNYDYIIVGAGISGLFLTYKLSATDYKILLLEKSNRVGGRIHTVHSKLHNVYYESGAARFNSSHNKTISLINELELDKDIQHLSNDKNYILRNCYKDYPYTLRDNDKLNYDDLLDKVINKSNEFTNNQLLNITFYQLCIDIIG